jgi:hypothetical protein
MPGDDDDLGSCDCGKKGWNGLPEIDLSEGDHWPLDFAARTLGIPLRDLKDLVRITKLEPSGTGKVATFRRSGRQPRVYPAAALIKLHEAIYSFMISPRLSPRAPRP